MGKKPMVAPYSGAMLAMVARSTTGNAFAPGPKNSTNLPTTFALRRICVMVTATDLALTVTQLMRKTKVVGKFVEFFGPGAKALPVVDRATIANMAPEYGATMGFFPIDEECVNYLRATGRSDAHCALYENYYKAQGLWGVPKKGEIEYSQQLELDLGTVVPSVAGPKRQQDKIELPKLKQEFVTTFSKPVTENGFGKQASVLNESFHVDCTDGDVLGGGS